MCADIPSITYCTCACVMIVLAASPRDTYATLYWTGSEILRRSRARQSSKACAAVLHAHPSTFICPKVLRLKPPVLCLLVSSVWLLCSCCERATMVVPQPKTQLKKKAAYVKIEPAQQGSCDERPRPENCAIIAP